MSEMDGRGRRSGAWSWCALTAAAIALGGCSRPPGGELQALLRKGDTAALEARLAKSDQSLSEAELQAVYAEFEVLDAAATEALERWVGTSPDNYHARLLRGIAYKRQAWDTRGQGRASALDEVRASNAAKLFKQADEQLSAALALDERPLMAAFHEMDALGVSCQRERMRRLLEQTRDYNRFSALVNNRFQWYLKPRWCGSHRDMSAFVEEERKLGMPESGLLQLEAIVEDDKGLDWLESRKPEAAVIHFARALEKAQSVGGRFQTDWLPSAEVQRCKLPQLKAYCP